MSNIFTYKKGFHDEIAVSKMKYKYLGKTGLKVSLLGFGGSHLGECYEKEQEEDAINSVITSVKKGINYIDTAPYYGEGKAEIVLGKALQQIPRETYYIATKVGRYTNDIRTAFDFSAFRTLKSIDESLSRLGLDYVDVIQVHDLEFAENTDIILRETLPALQKVLESGKVKFIGITGYPLENLKYILEHSTVKIDVVLSYCRCTLFDDSLKHYILYFMDKGVGIVNAAALGMGLLTNNGPLSWHPASEEFKLTCLEAAQYCKEKNVDISKIALHNSFNEPDISVHLIGMTNNDMVMKNLEIVWEGLSTEEANVLKDVKQRFFQQSVSWEGIEPKNYRKQKRNKVLKCIP